MVFVDSNIPMYVAGRDHPLRDSACRFRARAREGEFDLCTSIGVLQEILYRYASLNRLDLAASVYELFVQICPTVLPVTLADTDRAKLLLTTVSGISARGAVHAGVMLNHDVTEIATFDSAFDLISGVERLTLR